MNQSNLFSLCSETLLQNHFTAELKRSCNPISDSLFHVYEKRGSGLGEGDFACTYESHHSYPNFKSDGKLFHYPFKFKQLSLNLSSYCDSSYFDDINFFFFFFSQNSTCISTSIIIIEK